MSVSLQHGCGIPVDFPGFQNARMPRDVVVFYDDFIAGSISTGDIASTWDYTLLTTQATLPALLDGTDGSEDEAGGILNLVTDATVGEGLSLQVNGEMFHLADGYPLYFETRVNVGDISNVNFFVGLAVTDVAIIAGVTDQIGFEMASDVLYAMATKDSNDKTINMNITEADDDWIRLAFFWDGVRYVHFSVDANDDGVFDYKGTLDADTSGHYIEQAMMMTPSIEVNTGATATAERMYVDYILVMQQRFSE